MDNTDNMSDKNDKNEELSMIAVESILLKAQQNGVVLTERCVSQHYLRLIDDDTNIEFIGSFYGDLRSVDTDVRRRVAKWLLQERPELFSSKS